MNEGLRGAVAGFLPVEEEAGTGCLKDWRVDLVRLRALERTLDAGRRALASVGTRSLKRPNRRQPLISRVQVPSKRTYPKLQNGPS